MNIQNAAAPRKRIARQNTVNDNAPPNATDEFSCSRTTRALAEADLARSGLSLEQAADDGIFPVDDASEVHPDFAKERALIIPYCDAEGRPLTYEHNGHKIPFCRARYLVPPGYPLPRRRKYDQPADSGTPPYFPPCYEWAKVDRGEVDACVVVEGEKKATALCRVGIPAIAVGGVFNFAEGSAPLHSAVSALVVKCNAAYVLFDSDAVSKPQIQLAEWRLASQIALLGKRVHIVRIPAEDDTKVGADDYLLKHGPDALNDLILSTPALGEAPRLMRDTEITVADILHREVAPVEELIPGWLEKGIPTFLAGPGGVHKSRLAMQWALCLNAGASIWGIGANLNDLKPAKATMVYCAAEDDANELARRAQAISGALKLKKPNQGVFLPCTDASLVIMHESAAVEIRPFYHELVARLRRIEGHKIVVLDSAYDFVRFAGRAKIDEDAVNYFIKVILQGICDQTDSTLLIPWHPSQAGSGRDSMDGWSVAWHNAPRARLALKEVDGVEDTYELRAVKRNHGPKGQPINIKFHEGALLPCDALPDDDKAAAVRKACVEAALYADSVGAAFKQQNNITQAIAEQISKKAGLRLTGKQIKNELAAAHYAGELGYRHGFGKTKAGYCAPESAVETGVETGLKPKVETR